VRRHRLRRRIRLRRRVAALVGVAVLGAACTGGGGTVPRPAPAAVPATVCGGTLPGRAVAGLVGTDGFAAHDQGPPSASGAYVLDCDARATGRRLTVTSSTADPGGLGLAQLPVATSARATALPLPAAARDRGAAVVDGTLAWTVLPCGPGVPLWTVITLLPVPAVPAPAPGALGDHRAVLAPLLVAATNAAAKAMRCGLPALPPPGTPAAPPPVPLAADAHPCGAPRAAMLAVLSAPSPSGWQVSRTPPGAPAPPLRTCDVTRPDGHGVRFAVSRGLVAANAGQVDNPGSPRPLTGLPGRGAYGPYGAWLNVRCGTGQVAYRLVDPAGVRGSGFDPAAVRTLFAALVAAAGPHGCAG
jgi:hypothetical protein